MAPPLFPTCIFTSIQPRVSHISHRASWLSALWLHESHSTRQWPLTTGYCLELAGWNSGARHFSATLEADELAGPIPWVWIHFVCPGCSACSPWKENQDTWSAWLWPNVSCLVHTFQPWRIRTRSSHSWVCEPWGTCGWASGRSQTS